MIWLILSSFAAVVWWGILLLPWQPWRVREHLEAEVGEPSRFEDISVLIPARNEAEHIAQTVACVRAQGDGIRIIVIDDNSEDDTASLARDAGAEVIEATGLPLGWAGKLWALEQGFERVETPLVLLLDADISLRPGILAAMQRKLGSEGLQMLSLMAELRMCSFWEKLLMPAFVYYFRLLYPFALANGRRRRFAAAAGGCVLLERKALANLGGFGALSDALIDDCTLAARIKQSGGRIWVGLTHAVRSERVYASLESIWRMVARSAFTQLHYSMLLLLATTALMVVAYWLPLAALASSLTAVRLCGLAAWLGMSISYLPTLSYYRRSPFWALALPAIGTLYLAMTWSSAWGYWRGTRSEWKGRIYERL